MAAKKKKTPKKVATLPARKPAAIAVPDPLPLAIMKRDDVVRFLPSDEPGLPVAYVYLNETQAHIISEVAHADRAKFAATVGEWKVGDTTRFYYAVPALVGEKRELCAYLLNDALYRQYTDIVTSKGADLDPVKGRDYRVVDDDGYRLVRAQGRTTIPVAPPIDVRVIVTKDTTAAVLKAQSIAAVRERELLRVEAELQTSGNAREGLQELYDVCHAIKAIAADAGEAVDPEHLLFAIELMADSGKERAELAMARLPQEDHGCESADYDDGRCRACGVEL